MSRPGRGCWRLMRTGLVLISRAQVEGISPGDVLHRTVLVEQQHVSVIVQQIGAPEPRREAPTRDVASRSCAADRLATTLFHVRFATAGTWPRFTLPVADVRLPPRHRSRPNAIPARATFGSVPSINCRSAIALVAPGAPHRLHRRAGGGMRRETMPRTAHDSPISRSRRRSNRPSWSRYDSAGVLNCSPGLAAPRLAGAVTARCQAPCGAGHLVKELETKPRRRLQVAYGDAPSHFRQTSTIGVPPP